MSIPTGAPGAPTRTATTSPTARRRRNAARGGHRGSDTRRPAQSTTSTHPNRSQDRSRNKQVTLTGTFDAHPRGFGFVNLDQPHPLTEHPDAATIDSAFVPPTMARKLMSGDVVKVAVDLAEGRGTVTRIVASRRTRTSVFGQIVRSGAQHQLVPDPSVSSGALTLPSGLRIPHGSWVLWDLTGPGRVLEQHETLTPAAARTMVLNRNNLPQGHDAAVEAHADELADLTATRLGRAPEAGRVDLTGLTTVTIDGPTSLDLDDAISATRIAAGIRVHVHVADVAAAVPAGSLVDSAARKVGTSVYLPGWNRPMLPRTLSEKGASLLPNVARDALTVVYTVTPEGEVRDVDVIRARIVSDAKLTYAHTADVLAGTDTDTRAVTELLQLADQAAAWLSTTRTARTQLAADYDTDAEVSATVIPSPTGAQGDDAYNDAEFGTAPVTPSYPTEQLIERLMVAANESVAAWLIERALPGVFRTHEGPSENLAEDLDAFVAVAPQAARAPLTADTHLDRYLELVAREDDENTLRGAKTLLMRNMSRAQYTPTPGLHFGLMSSAYLHFTSPLRRYADLLVHRVIHAHLDGDTSRVTELAEQIVTDAEHLTEASSVASRVESQFRRHAAAAVFGTPGKAVSAVVSGFSPKGMFVTVPQTGLSGQVPFAGMPGRWESNEHRVAASDKVSGNVVRLGDRIRVSIAGVEAASAQVSFTRTARRAS